MNFSVSGLSSLAKLITANPNEASTLLKLTSVDVLKALGDGKYTVLLDNKTLTAQSDKPLNEGAKYWTQMSTAKNSTPQLSNLIKMPAMLKGFENLPVEYSLKDLAALLNSKKPEALMKQTLFEHLTNANTKEEFQNISNLLLSLQNHTLTIPIRLQNYFSILQMKKRYNKKSKKTQIDFYAALEYLGPIAGVITLEQNEIGVNLNVAFERTKNLLEDDMKNISYPVNISITADIEPLYNTNIHSLLDISI